jgi:uncharacterized membrane protein YcaP (DUF421 family)
MQPEDMNLSPQNPGFCYDIVMDGKVKQRALDALGYTQADVMSVLSRTGMQIKNVLIATSDETGRVFIQDKSGHQATGSIIHG